MLAAKSLSARRAWIEIKELQNLFANNLRSLSARRAWIEIGTYHPHFHAVLSLSARRAWIEIIDYVIDYATDASRSPQGERG